MAAYVRKVVGSDEKLIGIARLHWIYVVKGLVWLVGCVAVARLFGFGLDFLASMVSAAPALGLPIVALQSWLMRFALLFGGLICALYIIKVLTTEIGLTSRRIIYKRGWLFINVKEIDIEEIRGENLDLGFLGRVLNYGYIKLDCRFIGDVSLPAIEKPTGFLKALHKMRADVTDTVSLVVGDKTIAMVEDTAARPVLNHEAPLPPPMQQAPPPPAAPVQPVAAPVPPPLAASPPPPQKPASAPVDPAAVAAIVEQVVPAVAARVAEQISAEMKAQADAESDTKNVAPEDDLLQSFDAAANENELQPKPPQSSAS